VGSSIRRDLGLHGTMARAICNYGAVLDAGEGEGAMLELCP
jgi:hypothetical protein